MLYVRKIEAPWDKADCLARIGKRPVLEFYFEELRPRIPQVRKDKPAVRLGLIAQVRSEFVLSHPYGDFHDRLRVGVHIAVDRWSDVLRLAPPADRFFHTVPHVVLPEQSIRQAFFV